MFTFLARPTRYSSGGRAGGKAALEGPLTARSGSGITRRCRNTLSCRAYRCLATSRSCLPPRFFPTQLGGVFEAANDSDKQQKRPSPLKSNPPIFFARRNSFTTTGDGAVFRRSRDVARSTKRSHRHQRHRISNRYLSAAFIGSSPSAAEKLLRVPPR